MVKLFDVLVNDIVVELQIAGFYHWPSCVNTAFTSYFVLYGSYHAPALKRDCALRGDSTRVG
jgi:hypothetical protein